MNRHLLRRRARPRTGFTLLELVIVLMILAALAGLVISQVAQLGRSTDMAFTAKTQADVAENLQLHFVLQKRYPMRMDSLLVSNGAAPTGVYLPVSDPVTGEQIRGLPDSGPHLDRALVMGTVGSGITAGQWRSFTRCGFETVMDHDATATDSNVSGAFLRNLSSGTQAAAIIDPDTTNATAQGYLKQLFPSSINDNGTPADTSDDTYFVPGGGVVVAVALGPNSSCIPDTMLNAPLYPGCDGSYYGHYVALFACYESGERANLVGVADSYGRLSNYSIKQFNESLPNNQRRG